jgi:hypothetical protein
VPLCWALSAIQKPLHNRGIHNILLLAKAIFAGSDRLRDGASLSFGTDEYNPEEPSENNFASAAKKNCAIFAVHPRALEPGTRQNIWHGGSLPPGYSWQQQK